MDLTGAIWRKSSRSGSNGGQCIEVAAWRKSSRSSSNGGQCVEVAPLGGVVAVRDSKDPDGPKLAISQDAWRAFTARIRDDA
ncbi:DUF397 domain-containing protein [Spirillospora sp. CA-294931]|uniref:DUF397 domain-containing protein n=1 Tax=Spirillospora sp. CA-294931 TaxID=3240042 RepID=UPI003D8DCA8D